MPPVMVEGAAGAWEAPFDHTASGSANPLTNRNSTAWPHTTAPQWPPINGGNMMFHPVHAALIPKGPHQGKILLFDHQLQNTSAQPQMYQRWAILDPSPNAAVPIRNFYLPMPTNGGDLFCSGHAWTPNGDLLVAGGTVTYPANVAGGKLVYLFNPALPNTYYNDLGEWTRQADLDIPRWYPTVTLLHRFPEPSTNIAKSAVMISGGTEGATANPDRAPQTYEGYFVTMPPNPFVGSSTLSRDTRTMAPWNAGVFNGPSGTNSTFFQYPRLFLLSNGSAFMAGMQTKGARVFHETGPGIWSYGGGNEDPNANDVINGISFYVNGQRVYDSAVLMPINPFAQDFVARSGGSPYGGITTKYVEYVQANPSGSSTWQPAPSMHKDRWHGNLTLLPDASILEVGGDSLWPTPQPRKNPELFRGFQWVEMEPEASTRDYHSIALLLPDGRVLSGGGESHTNTYQIFSPPYLTLGLYRPQTVTLQTPSGVPMVINAASTAYQVTHGQQFVVNCTGLPPTSTNLAKIMLTAPGSVTHHSDMHQRSIELTSSVDPLQPQNNSRRLVQLPASDKILPQGYYMLWAVTNQGAPGNAVWVVIL